MPLVSEAIEEVLHRRRYPFRCHGDVSVVIVLVPCEHLQWDEFAANFGNAKPYQDPPRPPSSHDIFVANIMSLNRPLKRCAQCTRHDRILYRAVRTLTTTTEPPSSSETPPPPPSENATAKPTRRYNPNLVYTTRSERKLIETQNEYPIGSRRRRAALATSTNIPFSELPYQCFQEARKILQSDRAEKVREIQTLRERVAKLEVEGTLTEQLKVKDMKDRIEKLKVWADINDPLVKKRFEDGLGKFNNNICVHSCFC
jgi:large subunit ribosomal protein L35